MVELKDKGVPTRPTEGSVCTCVGGPNGNQHKFLLSNIDRSFKQDYDMHSERRKSSPTSETMRARVLSLQNGHS